MREVDDWIGLYHIWNATDVMEGWLETWLMSCYVLDRFQLEVLLLFDFIYIYFVLNTSEKQKILYHSKKYSFVF